MVSGRLQEKNGYFYMILDYKDVTGKRKNKWISTGLLIKGNKKKAEAMLMETRQSFQTKPIAEADGPLFVHYLDN